MAHTDIRKKLFLLGWGSLLPEQVLLARELLKTHDIAYWVRIEDVVPLDRAEFPKTIFHDYRAALRGVPAPGLSLPPRDPLSAAEIHELLPLESEMLAMMEKWYEGWSINRRKELYYEMVRYWSGVLEQLSPDALIFMDIPHELYSLVLYELAKRRGIETIMYENVLRFDRLLSYRDYWKGNDRLAAQATAGFPPSSLEELPDDVREYYQEVSEQAEPSPEYMSVFKREHTGWGKFRRTLHALWPFVKDGSIIERAVSRFFKYLHPRIQDEYARVCRAPEYEKKYVYVALHYQPERTTNPQGGVFSDQLLLIKTLSVSLPKGWELFVKEHPNQWLPHGSDYTPHRYPGFYDEAASLPNVRFVPTTESTFTLIAHAQAVATISGIAAWEGLLRGKPALLFGCAWFMHCPGAVRVDSADACRRAFVKIQEGFGPTPQTTINYLAAVGKESVRAYDANGKRVTTLTQEESWKNLYHAVIEVLK